MDMKQIISDLKAENAELRKALQEFQSTPVNNWVPCDSWEMIPVGSWLVRLKTDNDDLHIANVSTNGRGGRIILVGNYFHFDVGPLVAYKAI